MSGVEGGFGRLRRLLGMAPQAEVDEELSFHLAMRERDLLAAGLPPREARDRARRDFGDRRAVARECGTIARRRNRKMRWSERRGELGQDLRFGARQLRRNPGLALVAVATLALGIGANTAIFSAVSGAILRPLPFADPGRLVMLWEENPEKGWHMQTAAPANVLDWREQVDAFEDVAMYLDFDEEATLTGEGEPRPMRVASVSGNLFSVLGVRPEAGRTLREEETWSGGEPTLVLSHAAWTGRFGGDPGIVGRTVRLDDRAYEIVGVMPPDFRYPRETVEAWRGIRWDPANRDEVWFRRAHFVRAVARLRRGTGLQEADAQLQAVVRRLQAAYPETNRRMGAGITPLQRFMVGDTRTPLLVLLGAVGVLLLLACANVGNLLLVRASARQREIAVRAALGAGRGRLARQMLAESLLLSSAGGAVGLLVGWLGTRALSSLRPPELLADGQLGLDWRVLAFTTAVTAASGLLFGLVPALWVSRARAAEGLREGGRGAGAGRGARRTGSALVVAEVALAVLLVAGAGLLVRSFVRLQRVDPGFDAGGVLAARIDLPSARYDRAPKAVAFYAELIRRLEAVPGVESAGAVGQLPLRGPSWSSDFSVAGRPPDAYGTEVVHREVMPGYFRTLRVPLLRGRLLTEADDRDAQPVVLVNESMARAHFPGEDPIGQRICFDRVPGEESVWRTIVGVVGDEHQASLAEEPRIEVFSPLPQEARTGMSVVVRAAGDPLALVPALRREVAALDPQLALLEVIPLERVQADSLARQRFLMLLLATFAAVALGLAVVGVYGVLAQVVRQRRREIGIRLALGAGPGQVTGLIVRHGLALVAAGVAVGLASAVVGTRAMRGLLFQTAPGDLPTLAGVALLLVLAGGAAALVPARRASRTEPTETLRAE